MKAITEERLKEISLELDALDSDIHHPIAIWIEKYLLGQCQELDQLTVTKLRPMSECQTGWILKRAGSDQLHICTGIGSHGSIFASDAGIYSVLRENYEGCIPPIVYKPEQP